MSADLAKKKLARHGEMLEMFTSKTPRQKKTWKKPIEMKIVSDLSQLSKVNLFFFEGLFGASMPVPNVGAALHSLPVTQIPVICRYAVP